MAINFLAESMQGYNNPKIEIINVELDDSGALITPITFDDIAKILARGVFPILSVGHASQDSRLRYTLPLSYARDNQILFSTIVMAGTQNSPSGTGFGIKFDTSGTPLMLRMPLKSSIA